MPKWADYGISGFRYNDVRTHITRVRLYSDLGDNLGVREEWQRESVVSSIESGKTFVTILRHANGKFNKGQIIGIIKVKGVKYIRTDEDQTPVDNLEDLPEF